MPSWIVILFTCLRTADQQGGSGGEIVHLTVEETAAVSGKETTAVIHVVVKEGFHIQANRVNDASLIPAALEFTETGGLGIRKIEFPPYKIFQLKGTGNHLNVFDSTFDIKLTVKIPAAAIAGRCLMHARLHYQACNARTCLFPRAVDFMIPVVVLAPRKMGGAGRR